MEVRTEIGSELFHDWDMGKTEGVRATIFELVG